MSIKVTSDSVVMSKPFTTLELEVGECLGFSFSEDRITAIINKTSKVALSEFMKFAFKNFSTNPSLANERKLTYLQIKNAYEKDYQKFLKEFKPDELYKGENKIDEYQLHALYVMRNRKCNLFAAQMGLGKTIMSATLSKINNYSRSIVVTISGPKFSFKDDLCKKWGFKDTEFTILDANRSTLSFLYEKFVITNYESVNKFMPHLTRDDVQLIVIDECEKIKSPKTAIHKAIQKLLNHFPNAKVMFMSGTPIQNTVSDLFSYLKLSKHPLGHNFDAFKDRFWDSKKKRAKNIDLLRLMTANFTLRILSEDVVELPPLNITKTYISSADSRNEYESTIESMYAKNERFKSVDNEIKMMTAGPKLDKEGIELLKTLQKEKNELRVSKNSNIMKLNRINSMSKVKATIRATEELVAKGEKVVLFSYFSDTLYALKEHFGNKAVLIDGSVNPKIRMDYINQFHKDHRTMVFIGQHKAAGAGINLFNSCKGFMLDLPFVPSILSQITKRLHRRGQEREVDFNLTMIKGSIDDIIYDNILVNKDLDTNEILDKDNKKVKNLREVSSQELVFDALMNKYNNNFIHS